MAKRSLSEVKVVTIFASVCPYGIIPSSIEKRKPPEPDIMCQISDGSWVTFEVTESIDDLIAQRNEEAQSLKTNIKEYLNKSSLKNELLVKYCNAMISIYPYDRIPKKIFRSQKNIDSLLKFLANLPNDINEEEFNSIGKHKYIIEIDRGNFIGPIFNTDIGGSFNDYIIQAIDIKFFKKNYRTDLPIELLVYYHMQPGPFQWDVNEAIDFIKNNLKKSPFRRAWIFSTKENKILDGYPII
jgi:hypothetical protein